MLRNERREVIVVERLLLALAQILVCHGFPGHPPNEVLRGFRHDKGGLRRHNSHPAVADAERACWSRAHPPSLKARLQERPHAHAPTGDGQRLARAAGPHPPAGADDLPHRGGAQAPGGESPARRERARAWSPRPSAPQGLTQSALSLVSAVCLSLGQPLTPGAGQILADSKRARGRGIQLAHLSLVFMRPFTFWRGSAAAGPADAEPLLSLLDSIVKWTRL
jgi:hypothetical protein